MVACMALLVLFGMAKPAYAAQAETADLAAASAKSGLSATAKKGSLEAYPSKYSYTWTGKVVKPKITVDYYYWTGKCDIVKRLKAGRDYKLTYPTSTSSGEKNVKVVGKGDYAGMKTYARYYIEPHKRTISSYKLTGNTLKLNWKTYPDKTNYYAFSLAPTAAGAKRSIGNYQNAMFGEGNYDSEKWCSGHSYSNKKIKSTWGAGHVKFNIKKYRSKAYKKNYVYVAIAAVKLFEPKSIDFEGYPLLYSTPTVKKIKLS